MRDPFPLILMLGVLTACGGGGGGGPTGPGGNNNGSNGNNNAPPTSATVNMKTDPADAYGYPGASSFDPITTTISRGGTVTWSNSSGTAHNVTFDVSGSSPANIADIAAGTASRTFSAAGSFAYHCSNHAGMYGTIVVQ